jgi:hypothetical protein
MSADYVYTGKFKKLVEEIETEKKKFRDLSDAFPNSDIIKSGALKICRHYDEIIDMADDEIQEKEDEIEEKEEEIKGLENELEEYESGSKTSNYNPFSVKTLEDEMKIELFHAAMEKFTLVQLEQRLGTKFELM